MINLLPENQKHELRAARTNVILLRYNVITIIAIGLLGLFCAVFYVILSTDKNNAIEQNKQSSSESKQYAQTRAQADKFKKDLSLADKIFSKEVSYTEAVFAIANALPSGVILESIDLNESSFGNVTVFEAQAKDYASVTRLKENFQKAAQFEDAHLQTINDASVESKKDTAVSPYPITVSISVKIKKVTK